MQSRCCILDAASSDLASAAILQECTPHVIMAFDLVGAMCKRVGNAGYTGSKQQMWHLLATERFCNILESSAEASVELQQLTYQEHAGW